MTPHTRRRLALAALLWLGLWTASWAQMKFATAVEPRFARTMAQQVLTQAYQQLGMKVEFVPLPIRRGYAMAATGELDGVTISVADSLDPALLKVEVPVAVEETVVYTLTRQFKVAGFTSLQPYSIGHIAGLRYFETHLQGMKVDTAVDLETLFRKLALGRTDIALETRSNQCRLKPLGLTQITILEPNVEVVLGHHFLNQKHAELVPKLTQVLRKMEAEGSIKKIQATALKEFQAQCG